MHRQRSREHRVGREVYRRDKIDELIHRPPNLAFEGLQQLRYLILTEGLKDMSGECHYRNYVWTILLQVNLDCTQNYLELLQKGSSAADAKIQNDTFRTLATDKSFKAKVPEESLSRILNAYVQYHPDRTYVQGMNVIAAPFLYISRSESQAFTLFNNFVTKHCPLYVTPTLIGVHVGLDLVDIVLEIADPDLYAHLKAKMLTANLYAFASVMTFSAGTPPLSEVLKLWDLLMAYGYHLNILLVVAQVVMIRESLLKSAKPMSFLRSFPPLKAKEVATTALAVLQKIPRDVYELIVLHGIDSSVRQRVDKYRRCS